MSESQNRERVLFVCTHNSSRSQMAEGLLRATAYDRFVVYSAGTHPGGVHPLAVQAMAEVGIDISGHTSDHIDTYQDVPMDYVVTVCDSAAEQCPYVLARRSRKHKSFSDPSVVVGTRQEQLEAFRHTREEIRDWLGATFIMPTSPL